jgi:hypothetical protein
MEERAEAPTAAQPRLRVEARAAAAERRRRTIATDEIGYFADVGDRLLLRGNSTSESRAGFMR